MIFDEIISNYLEKKVDPEIVENDADVIHIGKYILESTTLYGSYVLIFKAREDSEKINLI